MGAQCRRAHQALAQLDATVKPNLLCSTSLKLPNLIPAEQISQGGEAHWSNRG